MIDEHREHTVGVDRQVEFFVDEKVVVRTCRDEPEAFLMTSPLALDGYPIREGATLRTRR